MINKQSLWFLTLFSIILVLSVYYVSMPDKTLATIANETKEKETINIELTDALAALKIEDEEEVEDTMVEAQNILLKESSTVDEKNNAYETIKELNSIKGKQEELENLIKEQFKFSSFVKIEKDTIKITISKKDHDKDTANNIIRLIQEQYDTKMYITVKFQ